MRILFTGSRYWTDNIWPAHKVMTRLLDLYEFYHHPTIVRDFSSLRIMVGDAPGVDQMVISYAHALGIFCTVHGCSMTPRATMCAGQEYVRVEGGYLARDRYMAEEADQCVAIWNGMSRGTKYTYEYMCKLKKQAVLINLLAQ